jgi:hypothetical protein
VTIEEKIRLLPETFEGRWWLAWVLPDEGPGPFDERAYKAAMRAISDTPGVRSEPGGNLSWGTKAQAESALAAARAAARPFLESLS